ncbi:MAG: threonine synthase [Spirochaetaceae bacterium]|jgi:threonine synthase|nr:threonine synthase [Spirochaetaceae bacterium]
MRYYSTRNKKTGVSFAAAALAGLAPDGGLFVPESIPQYPRAVQTSLGAMSFRDVAFETVKLFAEQEIPDPALADIIEAAYPFAAPLVPVDGRLVLELFHGPTAAFKDFGARFMARVFSYLRRGENKPLHILVATSGDTGGAAADGFYGVEGIVVTVLYPKGRVTPLQEQQIAGLGGNISALAVEGSFDDCQRLVKAAFGNEELKKRLALSSANSINITRLIPQAVYYAAAAGKAFAGKSDPLEAASPVSAAFTRSDTLKPAAKQPTAFCVPSGNFGNLVAGLYALEMGAPIRLFIAATNRNKTIPDYLETGYYEARFAKTTVSNAMDVGAPSNAERMIAQWSLPEIRRMVRGVSVSDEETRAAIAQVHKAAGYFLDPHTAVGWRGADILGIERNLGGGNLAVLATAHPAKFAGIVEPITGPVPVPLSLKKALERKPRSAVIQAELSALMEVLEVVR